MSDPLVTISETLVKLANSSSKAISTQDLIELKPFIENQTLCGLINVNDQGIKDNIIKFLFDIYADIFIKSIDQDKCSLLLDSILKKRNASNVEHQHKSLLNPSKPDFSNVSPSDPIDNSALSENSHKKMQLIEEKTSNPIVEEEKKNWNPNLPKFVPLPQPNTKTLPSEVKPIPNDKNQHLNPFANSKFFDGNPKIQEKHTQPMLHEFPSKFTTVKLYIQPNNSQEKFIWEHELKGQWEMSFSSIFRFKKNNTDIFIKHKDNSLQLYQSAVETDLDAYYISINREILSKNLLFLYRDYEISISEIEESSITISVVRGKRPIGIILSPDKPLWKDQMKKHFNVEKEDLRVNIYMGIGKWFIANEDNSYILYRMIHISEKMNKDSQMIMIEEDKIIKYGENHIIKLRLE